MVGPGGHELCNRHHGPLKTSRADLMREGLIVFDVM